MEKDLNDCKEGEKTVKKWYIQKKNISLASRIFLIH